MDSKLGRPAMAAAGAFGGPLPGRPGRGASAVAAIVTYIPTAAAVGLAAAR